jgi:cytochrome b561
MLRTDEDPELLVFDPVIRFFDWLTLFLVATIFVLAFSIDFASSKEEAVALIQLHRSFGVTVWVVMLARLVWRQFSRFLNWPADMPTSRSEDETTVQLLGVRLFNAAASGIKLALSGYYQTAFQQARDIMEVGYLLDYFRTSPQQRAVWKQADRKTRRQLFDPVKIRIALDTRDADTTKKREAEYDKLSELASHASFRGFRLTTRGEFGELAFVKKINLMAWLEEMVLRLGPAAVMYATQFPDADPPLTRFFQEFSTELIEGFKRSEVDGAAKPTTGARP